MVFRAAAVRSPTDFTFSIAAFVAAFFICSFSDSVIFKFDTGILVSALYVEMP